MQFLITFLEGIITFVSPCVLPMIPLYVLYFAGDQQEGKRDRTLSNALGFVLGFTILFVLLGLFAGTLGGLLVRHQKIVNLVTGAIVIVFGLHYAGVLKIGFLSRTLKPDTNVKPTGFFSAMVFGLVFAVGWSPCTGAFLGSAMRSVNAGSVMERRSSTQLPSPNSSRMPSSRTGSMRSSRAQASIAAKRRSVSSDAACTRMSGVMAV